MNQIVGLDFETANPKRNSACSIGIATLQENGKIEIYHELIRPPVMDFHSGCVNVHGITPDMVRNKPTFKDLWPEIKPMLTNSTIWAHNSPFERSVMKSLGEEYDIDTPQDIECTIQLSKRIFPELEKYNLQAVMDYLKLDFDHHDAGHDAWASVKIVEMAQELVKNGEWVDPMLNPWVSPDKIRGNTFAIMGSFDFGSKAEVLKAMRMLGVFLETKIKSSTPYLIVGGKSQAKGLEYDKTMKFIKNGGSIRLVKESSFWKAAQKERANH